MICNGNHAGPPGGAQTAADRALTLCAGSGPGKAKIVSARPGTVWDPTVGLGRFLALIISSEAEAHACLELLGLMWPRSTYDISARSRPGLESRSRGDRVCASRPPKPVATYLSVLIGSCRYDLRRESYWAARGVLNGARPRTHIFGSAGPDPTKGEHAAGRRLGPPGRPSTIPVANHISKSRSARPDM